MQTVPLPTHVRIAKVLFWVIPLLWIVNSVIARRAPGVITPHVLALGRWTLAGLALGWMARRELWEQRQELRQHATRYLALGACGMWICGAAVYFAGESTSMMNISLIYAASPVMITVANRTETAARVKYAFDRGRIRIDEFAERGASHRRTLFASPGAGRGGRIDRGGPCGGAGRVAALVPCAVRAR